jgi:peptidoglycan/xylan/chitin deacetylase (PgdA/CDA1 family)
MYLTRTPKLIQSLFPNFVWHLPTTEKVIYLTFDDGPIPEVTPWVLDELATYNAKATFFCVGDNVRKHNHIFEAILEAGHAVGNHTYHHMDGWQTDNIAYFHNIRHCAHLVKSNLFRPPYGRLKPKQAQFLQRHYQIVMWDVLSGDFDVQLSKEKCLENIISGVSGGSIIVLHDSQKARERLDYVLPRTLKYFSEHGYRFEAIDENALQVKGYAKSA